MKFPSWKVIVVLASVALATSVAFLLQRSEIRWAKILSRHGARVEISERGFSVFRTLLGDRVDAHGVQRMGPFDRISSVEFGFRGGATSFGTVTRLDDDAFEAILSCSQLESLQLHWTNITDDQFARLGQLRHLKHLDVSDSLLTDACGATIENLQLLESVDLSNSGMSEKVASNLAQLPHLRSIRFRGITISDTFATGIRRLPKLEYLDITGATHDPHLINKMEANSVQVVH